MRKHLIALLALAAIATAPALAQDWGSYGNARFGYELAIPPGFSGYGESDNGDGQVFDRPELAQVLMAWGSMMVEEDFEAEVASRMQNAQDDGWNLAAQTVTPRWASFSGVLGQRMFDTHMIQLCDGASYAVWTAEYSAVNAADMRPVIERLVESFRATDC